LINLLFPKRVLFFIFFFWKHFFKKIFHLTPSMSSTSHTRKKKRSSSATATSRRHKGEGESAQQASAASTTATNSTTTTSSTSEGNSISVLHSSELSSAASTSYREYRDDEAIAGQKTTSEDDGEADDIELDAPIGAPRQKDPIATRLLAWIAGNKCYLVAVVVIAIIAIALGAAEGALDLNHVDKYSPKSVIANRMRVKFALNSAPKLVNTTKLFVEPLTSATAVVTSALVLNMTKINTTTFDAQVEISGTTNITAAEVTALYDSAFGDARLTAAYGNVSNLNVTLNRSRVTTTAIPFSPWAAWLTLFIVVMILALLMQENVVSPDVAIMLAVVILTLAGVITPRDALSGFANESVATIGALYVVALGISNSGALDLFSRYVLGSPKSLTMALARLMFPMAIVSTWINNTAEIALMAPVVVNWSHRLGIAPSKLLIPLSYASILGGTLSMIGTSTNLIVKALAQARDPKIDIPLFGITAVGAPNAFIGILYMLFIGHRLLPSRGTPAQQFKRDPRAYTAHVVVKETAKNLIGQTLADAGLRHLTGLFVYAVERPSTNEVFSAPAPTFVLAAGDVLAVAGDVEQVNRLWRVDGLEMHADDDIRKLARPPVGAAHQLVEVVVAPGSSLVGRTPRELKFRTRFNAAIVGVHRRGEQMVSRIGDVRLNGGDVLLLVIANNSFLQAHRRSRQFLLVSAVGAAEVQLPVSIGRVLFAGALVVAMITLASIDTLGMSLFILALAVGYIFWLADIVTADEARSSVDISVMTMVASSIALSVAMQNSGLAYRIGTQLVNLFAPVGDLGLLFGMYIATTVLNAFVSNSAAVSLTFPIAYVVATQSVSLNVPMISYVLMMAGSADFSTPIGYQTNLMVYSLGNYRFLDYTKVGVPLQIVTCITTCVIAYYAYATPTVPEMM
jgi:di/tricarboxylate transporter